MTVTLIVDGPSRQELIDAAKPDNRSKKISFTITMEGWMNRHVMDSHVANIIQDGSGDEDWIIELPLCNTTPGPFRGKYNTTTRKGQLAELAQ